MKDANAQDRTLCMGGVDASKTLDNRSEKNARAVYRSLREKREGGKGAEKWGYRAEVEFAEVAAALVLAVAALVGVGERRASLSQGETEVWLL